jgi:hypothetical protein
MTRWELTKKKKHWNNLNFHLKEQRVNTQTWREQIKSKGKNNENWAEINETENKK